MSKVLEKKRETVTEIAQKINDSKTLVVTDYRGLNVSQINELRKQLRSAGIDYKVYKNTLTRRATSEVGLTDLDDQLNGPTAIAFSNEDAVAPAKILHEFAKKNKELEIKGGVIEGQVVGVERVEDLAKLPDYNTQIAMLASVFQAPIRNFALAIKAVAEKQDQSQEG